MKKLLCMLLAILMVLSLCACAGNTEGGSQQGTENNTTEGSVAETTEEVVPETTEQVVPETTVHEHTYEEKVTKEASCKEKGVKTFTCACGDSYTEDIKKLSHKYSDATCSAPKTCSVCGKTDGKAKAHTYEGGKCTVCGGKQKDYKKLTDGHWLAYVVAEHSMEELEIFFYKEDNTGYFSVAVYEESSMMIGAKEVVIDGKTWYEAVFGYGGDVTYTEKGNTIVLEVDGRGQQGTITLERIAGNKLKVTKVTGTIIDKQITEETKVGTVYTWSELNYE